MKPSHILIGAAALVAAYFVYRHFSAPRITPTGEPELGHEPEHAEAANTSALVETSHEDSLDSTLIDGVKDIAGDALGYFGFNRKPAPGAPVPNVKTAAVSENKWSAALR